MRPFALLLIGFIISLPTMSRAEFLEVETIKKAEVILIGFIKADFSIEIAIIVKSPVDFPPVCKILVKDTPAAESVKWFKLHSKEQTILFATVDKDTLELTPQFGTYSFWPQGHDRGHWIDRKGYPPVELYGAVIGQASHGENFMKKSYHLYKASPDPGEKLQVP